MVIYTLELKNVLAIPNKALHFKPSEVMLAPGETITDCEASKKVWVKNGNEIKAVPVETGVTNGMLTQVTNGLTKGTKVITEAVNSVSSTEEEEQGTKNPFMPQPKKKNEKKK